MNGLGKLAEWWTNDAYPDQGASVASLAPQLADLCSEIAQEQSSPSSIEKIDRSVAVSLEDCLTNATPLGRHTLMSEIRSALNFNRDVESFSALNDLAVFSPVITGYRKPSTLINGLREHDAFSGISDWTRDASTELLTEALAVMVATVHLDGTTGVVSSSGMYLIPGVVERVYLADPEMVSLFRSRTGNINELVDIAKGNPGISADLIVDMFEHEQKALRGGLL